MSMKQDMKDLWSELLKAATRYDDKDETRAVAEVLSRCLGEPLGDPEEVLTEEEQQKKQELVQNFMNCILAPRDTVSNPMNRVVLDFLQTLLNRTERKDETKQTERDRTVEEPRVTRLLDLYERLNVKHTFRPGQLVRWKPGLRYQAHPLDGAPAVVTQVLSAPIYDGEQDSGSRCFHDPLDIQLLVGLKGDYGDCGIYYYNSRMFEPYK